MEKLQKEDIDAFEKWWAEEGSKRPPENFDEEEKIYHKSREAWLNGAFIAEMRCEGRAADKYNKEQEWQQH